MAVFGWVHLLNGVAIYVLGAVELVIVVEYRADVFDGINMRINTPRNVIHYLLGLFEIKKSFILLILDVKQNDFCVVPFFYNLK
jgi:hypothetical protein